MINFSILDNNHIDYIVKVGSYKRFSIRIKDRVVIINYPKRTNKLLADEFIEKNLGLIKKYLNQEQFICNYELESPYLIKGTTYIIKLGNVFKIDDELKYIYVTSNNKVNIKKELDNYLNTIIQSYYLTSLNNCLMKMKDDIKNIPNLIIKQSVRNWGYCSPKKNLIMLNRSLIHVPYPLFEYVICHELSHFVYLNHSKDFHNLLKKYLPNERILKKELKKYPIVY